MEAAMLVHNWLSSILDCIFLHHILEITPNIVYQALDGHLIDNNGRTPVRTAKKWPWPL